MTNKVARGSLLGIEHMEAPEILKILNFARRMNPQKPRPLLRGKRVILLFYEASTRTRSSLPGGRWKNLARYIGPTPCEL